MAVADDYGLGASRGIQASLAKLKVAPVAVTSYAPSDKDMSAQLLEIKDKDADSLNPVRPSCRCHAGHQAK